MVNGNLTSWVIPKGLTKEELKELFAQLEQTASECGRYLRWWQDVKKEALPPDEFPPSGGSFNLSP